MLIIYLLDYCRFAYMNMDINYHEVSSLFRISFPIIVIDGEHSVG